MATAVSSVTSAAPVAHDAAAPLGIALYGQLRVRTWCSAVVALFCILSYDCFYRAIVNFTVKYNRLIFMYIGNSVL